MARPTTSELLPERLTEHRAVRAWSRLESESIEPEGIEVLKTGKKSAVYRLVGVGPKGASVIAKRCPLATGLLERMIYEEFLSALPLPALRYYGMVEEPDTGFCWAFLEDARGQEYSTGNREHRELAGRWLGTIHKAAASAVFERHLPGRQPDHYLELLRASRATLVCHLRNPALGEADLLTLQALTPYCDLLEAHWSELEGACAGVSPTLVHGDFSMKNVRVATAGAGLALLVFDWEYAGWGVPASDLVQFMGRTLSPDLGSYRTTMNGLMAPLALPDIERLAECGKFFRLLDGISWSALLLVFDSYTFLVRPMSYLRSYEARFAEALRTAPWLR